MTQFDDLLKKTRDYLIIRLQRLAAQDIRALRTDELSAITGQAELLQANGLFTVQEADALIVHAREVFDGRAQPSADANW